ncbi:uncharacterized protein [Hetaerina americana]|uniref:uncharacterized protein isoform X2 n=1 Tax=Hetaerina americana TaxID=62018 RepID=UPI003A7F4E3E
MMGDESFNSTSDARSEQIVASMVKTGVLDISFMNNKKVPEIQKMGASQPSRTNENLKGGEAATYREEGIFMDMVKTITDGESRVLNHEEISKYLYSLLGEASRALVSGNFRLSLSKHKEVLDLLQENPTHVFEKVTDYIWLKYAYVISLIEVNNYSSLINAVNYLQELKLALYAEMPTYHYAVAKLLLKFNRFHLAEEEIQKCRDAMVGHDFKEQFWFGTEEVIKEASQKGLENYLEELSTFCRFDRLPDATCKFDSCMSANSHPYPSREIFHSDPDFKGYVVLICQEGCNVHYHPSCWKNIKESLTNYDKLSDKECLGKPCLTPDCKNSTGEPSVIQKIEIYGSDGNIKSQCVHDLAAEIKQKEIALKRRQRLISDEHKHDKLSGKGKQKAKKVPEHSQSNEVLDVRMKNQPLKENKHLKITGGVNVKKNMPAQEKDSSSLEMNNLTDLDEFVRSYFMMLLTTLGPLSKQRVEDEVVKFNAVFPPMAGLITKNGGIFNLLKSFPCFVMVDELLCIKESQDKGANCEKNLTGRIKKVEDLSTVSQPAATNQEPLEPSSQLDPSKQLESSRISETLKESPIVKMTPDIDRTGSKIGGALISTALENAVSDIEIKEIEKELRSTSLFDHTSNNYNNTSDLLNSKLLDSPGKNQTKVNNDGSQHIPDTFSRPFSFFEKMNEDKREPSIPTRDHQEVTGIPFQKINESMPVMHSPYGYFVVPPGKPPPPSHVVTSMPPPPLHHPIPWPINEMQTPKHMPYESQDMFKPMMVFPPGGMNPPYNHQFQSRRDIGIQTDEKCEEKSTIGDETWVQHMQLAVNELMKKNKDLMLSKDELMKANENEVEALKNQMKSLKQGYEQYITSLKECIKKNEEDRKTLALEQRMKLQEQILNSTKEELRNKDFDLLEAKKLLGKTILERIESDSCKQVTRLVTALASLPCNGKEAETVGQAMSKWESTSDKASKAKSEFMAACMRHQAKLIDGYCSDTLNELVIPTVEEPAGLCPLDSLTLKLLHEKENAAIDALKTTTQASFGIQPFRNRNTNATPRMPFTTGASVPVTAPLSPVSLGARPRDSGDASLRRWPSAASLRRWPSTHSVQSTHSSSGGNARPLSNFQKLLIELKRCYPSRSDDELFSAIKLARRKNRNTLSGLTIEKIVGMVGNVLGWWPEPVDGAMGLDKFMGWASDVTPAGETFCSNTKGHQHSAWIASGSSPNKGVEKIDCCICLQEMSEPKTDLICSHSFHTHCIRQWLSKESVCPICRKFTRMPDEFPTLKKV